MSGFNYNVFLSIVHDVSAKNHKRLYLIVPVMKRIKQSKKHLSDSNRLEGFTGLPHEPGPQVRGASFEHHGVADVFPGQDNRTIDNFKRPSGYHPAQPYVADQLGDAGAHQPLLNPNTTMLGDTLKHTQKNRSHHRMRTLKVLLISLLVLGLVGVLVFLLTSGHLNPSRLIERGRSALKRVSHYRL